MVQERRNSALAWLLAAACGPTTAVDTDGGSSGAADTGGSSTQGTTTTGASATTTSGVDASSSDGGTTLGDSSGSSSEGSNFIIDPDGGTGICGVALQCDLWAQDCAEGEKCVPWVADGSGDLDACLAARCSPLDDDPVAPGGVCTVQGGPWSGLDDCDIGSFCWGVDPTTLEGTCTVPCMGSEANPLCPDDDSCFIGYGGQIVACVADCDPLAPSCAGDTTCAVTDGKPPVCLPSAFELPTGQATPCVYSLGCGDGFACMPATAVEGCADPATCCTAVCDLEAPACEAAVPACTPIDGIPGVGACTIR